MLRPRMAPKPGPLRPMLRPGDGAIAARRAILRPRMAPKPGPLRAMLRPRYAPKPRSPRRQSLFA
jgi:hypothetical protein